MMKHKKVVQTITLATLLAMSMEQVKAMGADAADTSHENGEKIIAENIISRDETPPKAVLDKQEQTLNSNNPLDSTKPADPNAPLTRQDANSNTNPNDTGISFSSESTAPAPRTYTQAARDTINATSNMVNNTVSRTASAISGGRLSSGNLKTTVTDPASKVTTVRTTDSSGNVVAEKLTNPDGSTVETTYNTDGNQTKVVVQTAVDGKQTTTSYDDTGNITGQVEVTPSTSKIFNNKTTTTTFYKNGQPDHAEIADSNGKPIADRTYDSDGKSYTTTARETNKTPGQAKILESHKETNNGSTTTTTNPDGSKTATTIEDNITTTTTTNKDGSQTIVTTDTTNADAPITTTVKMDKSGNETSKTINNNTAVVKAQQDLQASRSKNNTATQADIYTKSDAAFKAQDDLITKQQEQLTISTNKVLISDMITGTRLTDTRSSLISTISNLNDGLDALTADVTAHTNLLTEAQNKLETAEQALETAKKALNKAITQEDKTTATQNINQAKTDFNNAQLYIKMENDAITQTKANIKAKTADLAKQSDLLSKTNDQLTALQNKMLTSKPSSAAIMLDRLTASASRIARNSVNSLSSFLSKPSATDADATSIVTKLLNDASKMDKNSATIFTTNVECALKNPSPQWNVTTLTKVEKVFTEKTTMSKLTGSNAEKTSITLPLAKDASWLSSSSPKLQTTNTDVAKSTAQTQLVADSEVISPLHQ